MVERTIEDELPPISEEPAFFSEEVSPEYERNLSPEVEQMSYGLVFLVLPTSLDYVTYLC